MNLKPEELVKALRHCSNDYPCKTCPVELQKDESTCIGVLFKHCIDQIERDQKEIAKLKAKVEQIEALEAALMGKAVAQITEFEGLPIARLRELAVADKDGRVGMLPCKVGDVLYAAESAPVIPLHVMDVAIYLALEGEDGGDYERISNIGKTVFLTREEAEKALAKMEGK